MDKETLIIENKIIRQYFDSLMLYDWGEGTINKCFNLLNNPETDVLDCDKQMKEIISEMDWGDIPKIIHYYIQASYQVEFARDYMLKDRYDYAWYYTPHHED